MAYIRKRVNKKSGKTVYTVEIQIKGYQRQTATFDKLTHAKDWANAVESDMKRGKYKNEGQARRYTLSQLIDKYIEEKLPERKTNINDFLTQINWWKDKIGQYLLSEVTPSLLSKYKNILAKEPSPRATKRTMLRSGATVNRYMAALSIVFTKAVKEWELMESNPMLKVEKYKETKGRTRSLTNEEQDKLLDACKNSGNDLIYLLVVLALSTGARYGEIINLTWKNIKIDDSEKTVTLYLMNTKNGDNRTVYAYGLGYELLKKHSKNRKNNSNLIFARADGLKPYDLRKQWCKVLKTAKIEDFRFHDLRHTTASNLAMNGASIRDLAEILGHKTLQMVQRYSHLTTQHTKAVLKELNEKQFRGVKI